MTTLRFLRSDLLSFLPLGDTTLASIGVLSRIFGFITMGLASYYPTTAPWVYCVVSMGSTFFSASNRSILSKLVDRDEKGSLFAIIGVIESLTGVLSGAIYNAIYASTIKDGYSMVLSGLVFFFSAGLYLQPLVIFIWSNRNNRWTKFIERNTHFRIQLSDENSEDLCPIADSEAASNRSNFVL